MSHRRFVIAGNSGSGKSTLARQLAAVTGLEVIHLDRHFWRPGWVETPAEEWRATQALLLAGEGWVAEGNYDSTLDIRCARADCVVYLDPPR